MGLSEALNSAVVLGEDDLRRRELGEYDTVLFKTFSATLVGTLAGGLAGNVRSMWMYQLPRRNLPAVRMATTQMTRYYAITFGLVCGSYALADAVVEQYRGKRNFVNSIYAGIFAGGVMGLKLRSIPKGVGSAALFAASTAVMDALGHTTKNHRPVDRALLPFPKEE